MSATDKPRCDESWSKFGANSRLGRAPKFDAGITKGLPEVQLEPRCEFCVMAREHFGRGTFPGDALGYHHGSIVNDRPPERNYRTSVIRFVSFHFETRGKSVPIPFHKSSRALRRPLHLYEQEAGEHLFGVELGIDRVLTPSFRPAADQADELQVLDLAAQRSASCVGEPEPGDQCVLEIAVVQFQCEPFTLLLPDSSTVTSRAERAKS